jgi:hypothetical protein
MSDRLGEAWRSYRTKVIPLDASSIHATESRRAFYAGARAMLASIMGMLDPGTEPTEVDLWNMDELDEELTRFAAGAAEGRF